jgi:hypothetical protein
MSTLTDSEALDKAKAEEIISKVELIPEVESIDVELYTDHTGDPSFQLVFGLRENVHVDQVFMKRFVEFSREVQMKILHSDLNRFPYTRFKRVA